MMSVSTRLASCIITVPLLLIFSLEIVRRIVTRGRKFFTKKDRPEAPECLRDPALGVHHTVQLKAIKLHYVESGPPDGQLMVFIHGFPEFWYSWRHQIVAFNNTYRVVAIDKRGYGWSDKPSRVEDYSIDKVRDDVGQLIQILTEGRRKCVVISHDWGGAVCWAVAAHYSHLVERVVIMNSPHLMAIDSYRNSSWLRSLTKLYQYLVDVPWLTEWFLSRNDHELIDFFYRSSYTGVKPGSMDDQHLDCYKYTFNKYADMRGPVQYVRAHGRGLHTAQALGHVPASVPVLLLWGTKDNFLPFEMARWSRDYADDFRLELVEGASHWVQQDAPQEVNNKIRHFLS